MEDSNIMWNVLGYTISKKNPIFSPSLYAMLSSTKNPLLQQSSPYEVKGDVRRLERTQDKIS
jgi:hypothetical protein